jgi:hypothetical protein
LSKCARTQEEWDRAKKCKTFRHHVSAIVLKAGDTSISNRLRSVIKQLALRPGFSLISSLAEPSGGLSVVFRSLPPDLVSTHLVRSALTAADGDYCRRAFHGGKGPFNRWLRLHVAAK